MKSNPSIAMDAAIIVGEYVGPLPKTVVGTPDGEMKVRFSFAGGKAISTPCFASTANRMPTVQNQAQRFRRKSPIPVTAQNGGAAIMRSASIALAFAVP